VCQSEPAAWISSTLADFHYNRGERASDQFPGADNLSGTLSSFPRTRPGQRADLTNCLSQLCLINELFIKGNFLVAYPREPLSTTTLPAKER